MRGGLINKYARPLTPSNEGFFDGLRTLLGKRTKDKTIPVERLNHLEWMDKNLRNGQLGSHLRTVSGPVVIPQSYAGYFTRGGKQLRTGLDEYDADLNVLNVIFKRIKPIADKYLAVATALEKAVDKIKNDDPVEVVNKVLEGFVGKFPISPADAYDTKWEADPWGWVGGYRKGNMVVVEDREVVWNTDYELPAATTLAVSFADASGVSDAIKLLAAIVKFQLLLEELDDTWPIGLDATDPPLRAHSYDDTITQKAWEGFGPGGHDQVYLKATGLRVTFSNRLSRLEEGLVVYLKAATQPA